MKAFVVFGLLLACVVSAYDSSDSSGLADSCAYVHDNSFLTNAAAVKACFESYEIDQDFVDIIIKNLKVISDIYPYVDIAKNPPENVERRYAIDYDEELKKLEEYLADNELTAANVFRATQKFIASFHDGHFGMSPNTNMTNDLFVLVSAVLPFTWEYFPDDNGDFHLYLYERPIEHFLSNETRNMIIEKRENMIPVDNIDNKDPFEFFTGMFGDYNMMKSVQGANKFSYMMAHNGFSVLKYPLDNLFDEHSVVFSDGSSFEYTLGFVNQAASRKRDVAEFKSVNPFTFVTMKEEMEALKKFQKSNVIKKLAKSMPHARAASKSGVVYCNYSKEQHLNWLSISSFSADIEAFVMDITSCATQFDDNKDPIFIVLNNNGGGYIVLELLSFMLLFPNSDPSILAAIRKTDTNKDIAVDGEYATSFAYNKDNCEMIGSKGVKDYWKTEEVDDLGAGVKHKRTEKAWWVYKALAADYKSYMLKNARKPTDVIVATDGFCFSACSMFVDNILRTGSAIVTGFGPTDPDKNRFVAAQCPSSVISPTDYVKDLQKTMYDGVRFQVTYTETFNISGDLKETIPGDYETMRIDKHLGIYQLNNLSQDVIMQHVNVLHEEFQTTCNPYNERLIYVTNNCSVKDDNALDVGYPCGSDGHWDSSECRIATCKSQYAVDFKNNKCIINNCDPRYEPKKPSPTPSPKDESSSSMVAPLFGIISLVLLYLAY